MIDQSCFGIVIPGMPYVPLVGWIFIMKIYRCSTLIYFLLVSLWSDIVSTAWSLFLAVGKNACMFHIGISRFVLWHIIDRCTIFLYCFSSACEQLGDPIEHPLDEIAQPNPRICWLYPQAPCVSYRYDKIGYVPLGLYWTPSFLK